MRYPALLCGIAAIALAMSACRQSPPVPAAAVPDTHNSDIKAITEDEVQWNNDWAARDGAKVLGHYAEDAILMAPGMEPGHAQGDERSRQLCDDLSQAGRWIVEGCGRHRHLGGPARGSETQGLMRTEACRGEWLGGGPGDVK